LRQGLGFLLAAALLLAGAPAGAAPSRHAAGGLPDRIVLSPGADAARALAVAWRTDARQGQAIAQIAVAPDGPDPERRAVEVRGETRPLRTENGRSHHHAVRFGGLEPDTAYLYRLRGADGWSEWFQTRTAAAGFRPFRFVYLGDLQNDILEIGARTVREAVLSGPRPALVLHAGDLVQQRAGGVHDDEWGEWNETGGWFYATVPQIPAAGNHEYLEPAAPGAPWRLGPHWPLQFALPRNGAPSVPTTSYTVDHQGVRFVVLDGTAALQLATLEDQARWLDRALDVDARWTVVLMHQPFWACARPRDNARLIAAWRPLFERRGVDLVLQGHDHCYGRMTAPAETGQPAAPGGPVYVISIAGGKMYALNDKGARFRRVAEDTQLYQTVDVEADRLRYRAFTATGVLYDGFDLLSGSDGGRVVEVPVTRPARTCRDRRSPDGGPCTARRR